MCKELVRLATDRGTTGLKPLQPPLPFIHITLLGTGVHSARRALHALSDATSSLAAHRGLLHAFNRGLFFLPLLCFHLLFLILGWRRYGRPSRVGLRRALQRWWG